jgi:hypothetical protein
MSSRALLLALVLAGAGCDTTLGPAGAAPSASASAAPLADKGFYGKVVPRKATPLHAPPNVFRMKGWNSTGTWIKLMEITPDGTRVEAGKEVGRFEFQSEDARRWIEENIRSSRADLEGVRSEMLQGQRRMSADAERLDLAAERAELETGKRGLVSERELSLLEIAHDRARVEATSAEHKAASYEHEVRAALAVAQARLEAWTSGTDRYAMYEKRVHVLAPHAGWVRHAYINNHRRKVQQPDHMPSGTPFAYIAEDEGLGVEFFVPEHRIAKLAIGGTVRVRLADDERRCDAKITFIAPFPQEIGFLRGDDELPDAREKAFQVTAELMEPPPLMQSGIEVRVEP